MKKSNCGRAKHGKRAASLFCLFFAVCVLCAACVTQKTLRREAERGPRNASGVLLAAQERSIDPPASWFAAHPECHGRAPRAVLLLHGFVDGPGDYADLGERLAAQGYHVRLMRLPGHGTTPQDFAKQTPDSMLNAVLAEYDALRRDYPAVDAGGFSMGGALVTLLAARRDVSRLMLFSPYYGVTYRWFYVLPAEQWNGLLSPVIHYVPKPQRWVKVNRKEVEPLIFTYHVIPTKGAATLMTLGRQARAQATLSRIHCPVLLLAAEGDEAAAPSRMRQALGKMPSLNKQETWLGQENNHQIFWDYCAERAKQATLDWMGPAERAAKKAPEAKAAAGA